MKIRPSLFRAEWDLHAWVGVLTSLPLFVMFFCGALSMFEAELVVWQERAHRAASPPPEVQWSALLDSVAAEHAPGSISAVSFETHPQSGAVAVSIAARDAEHTYLLDPTTGTRVPASSRLAHEIYRLHFLEPLPYGTQLSGLLSVALLAVTISGVLVHIKNLPGDLWRFRPHRKRRISAGDAHKVLGIFGLPFALVYGWSGALLGLWSWHNAAFEGALGEDARIEDLRGYPTVHRAIVGEPREPLPLDELVQAAARVVSTDALPEFVHLELVGDASAWAGVFWPNRGLEPRRWARVDAVTGEVFTTEATAETPANAFEKVLFDLHYAQFGSRVVQLCYALLALATAAVIVTGTIVWLERRDARRARPGNRFLERATVGVACGLVVGCALAFLLNRVVPPAVAVKADLEIAGLYGTWGAIALLAQIPGLRPRRLVVVTAAVAGALYLGSAVISGGLVPSLAGNPIHGAVTTADLVLLALAGGCGAVAVAVRRGA